LGICHGAQSNTYSALFILATALGRTTRGQLRLSRRQAALRQFAVGQRFVGTVVAVESAQAVLRLETTEDSQPLDPLVGTVGRDQWPVVLPTGASQTERRAPQLGETLTVKVMAVDAKGRLKLTLRRAAEQALIVPPEATARIGRLIGAQGRNRMELEQTTGAEIYVDRQPKPDSSQLIFVNAPTPGAVAAAVEAIRRIIPQVRLG